MKKRQIVAMLACLIVGMVGFAGTYTAERTKNKTEEQPLEQEVAENPSTEEMSVVSKVVEPEVKTDAGTETQEEEEETEEESTETLTDQEIVAAQEDGLHFIPEDGMRWPLEGSVLLNYSMDQMIYFPTLEQYQYNPALIIEGAVNSKVYIVAKGTITDIYTNEETGCTVVEDLGDGYTAIYGQLKEVNFAVGDSVERGQVIGYVNEPTKYYSVEGSNLYFAMQKDGEPVNPIEYFE